MKGTRLQPPVVALAHHPLHVLLRDLEIPQQGAFELVAAFRIVGDSFHPFQRQPDLALLNRLAERRRPAEVSMRKLFNLPHAQFLSAHCDDEVLDLLPPYSVHAHELPQRVHVGVNRKTSAEDFLPHPLAHLPD